VRLVDSARTALANGSDNLICVECSACRIFEHNLILVKVLVSNSSCCFCLRASQESSWSEARLRKEGSRTNSLKGSSVVFQNLPLVLISHKCVRGCVLRQQTSQLHEMALKPNLERFIAVDRNGNTDLTPSLRIDMMATVDSLERPSMRFEQTGEFLAGKRFHSASSIT
jgi:hypothetical protein